jgi:hypothetical protein
VEGIPGVHVESAVGYPVEDVEAYIKALKGKGLLASMIHKRLTGLKNFFESRRDRKG